MTTTREEAVFGIWRTINEIADTTEDSATIRNLIAEAGVTPGMHVGTHHSEFTPLMVGEWVLGQWADMIDSGSPFLNSARNISHAQWDKLFPPEPEEETTQ